MAENCSNVDAFTASFGETFHMGIILYRKEAAINCCWNVYETSAVSSGSILQTVPL